MLSIRVLSKATVDERWERVAVELDRVTRGAAHGEFETEDLKQLIKDGRAFGLYSEEEGIVSIVCVWELIFYPRRTVANVIALAGRDLVRSVELFWDIAEETWRTQGAHCLECSTTPAMARFLNQKLGFQQVYVQSRKEI